MSKNIILTILFSIALFPLAAQQKVLVVFPEDANFTIPKKFVKNETRGHNDSSALKFFTLKHLFYNSLTQRLAEYNFIPRGGVEGTESSYRKYTKGKWEYTTGTKRKKKHTRKYFSTVMDGGNKSYFQLQVNAEPADYVLVINKVRVFTNVLLHNFSMTNYRMEVHFDVYDSQLNHLGGRYLRKKVRLHRNMYWSSFTHQFSALPDELALHFVNTYKKK